ncbi:MAG TPA: O-antigen translocase [Bryobacteraceae bacterium]|nr:O-antigen translocase [Bryobacteraceae bacterium]
MAKSSYSQILKSTSLIGGASLVNIAIGIIRSKIVAMILGPSGMGLNSLFLSITNLSETVGGMGVNSSGVRQIAAAAASGDRNSVAKTAAVLRKTSLILGLVTAAFLVLASRQVSTLTFGNREQAAAICFLAVGVFMRFVSAGQGTLLQGLRRISDMTQAGMLSTFLGMLVTVALVFWLREDGIVASFVVASTVGLGVSWQYSRKAGIDRTSVTFQEARTEAAELLQLGSVLMVSGLAMMGSSYVVRAMIQTRLGLEATGLYQAAWSVGNMYVGFILTAMGADFYPRLTESIHDHAEANRLVNEQTQVSLLLAGAGIIGTLTFASLVIKTLYAASFAGAEAILQWICLGTALQVVSWPVGFIIVGKGDKAALVLTEIAWTCVHLSLVWLGLQYFGVPGAGLAFFLSYIFHTVVVYVLARRLTGFRWSAENQRALVIYMLSIGIVMAASHFLPRPWGIGFGAMALAGCLRYSAMKLLVLVPEHQLPSAIRRVFDLWLFATAARVGSQS